MAVAVKSNQTIDMLCGGSSVSAGPAVLPDPSKWPTKTRPVYFMAEDGVTVHGHRAGNALPLGTKLDFETELFKGYYFLRLRDINPHDDDAEKHSEHAAYFEGKKRFYQLVIQGQFKAEDLTFADLVMGDVYERPLQNLLTGRPYRLAKMCIEYLAPGILFDIGHATQPKVLTPIGGVQSLSVDLPGQQPSEFGHGIKENTSLIGQFSSKGKRRKKLSNPKTAVKYKIDTSKVYTFEAFDHTMDFGNFQQHVMPGFKIDLVPNLDGQTLSVGMYKRQGLKCLFNFSLWHEKQID